MRREILSEGELERYYCEVIQDLQGSDNLCWACAGISFRLSTLPFSSPKKPPPPKRKKGVCKKKKGNPKSFPSLQKTLTSSFLPPLSPLPLYNYRR